MKKLDGTDYVCDHCNFPAGKEDTFCRNWGELFYDGVSCLNHPSVAAKGACVICGGPYCKKCGKKAGGYFLCNLHLDYEVQEGMARVYGTMDNVEAQRVNAFLTQAGYHPFLYSKIFNPSADLVALSKITRGYGVGNYPLEEQKIFVPFSEVIRALGTLREMEIREDEE